MFENDVVDFFTRVPWWIVPTLWLPVVLGLFTYGVLSLGVPLVPGVFVAAAGWLAWTLTEYWLHRTFFHWVPNASWGARMHFFVHGVHHDWPDDRYRLVMPPAVSGILFVLFMGIFYALLGGVWMFPFYAGFVFGYTVYDCTHYATHHFKPRSARLKWFKRLASHHMNHHFQHKPRKYGVSTTLWDHVFGTYV
jgi:sterol desaturase/sphingolipid hydroxylase (fatty acid hydroxylase superfamily)